MRSRFWAFVEDCDEARSTRAVRELVSAAMRACGFDGFAILTHAPPAELGSLAVQIHNLAPRAVDHLVSGVSSGANPLFDALERSEDVITWSAGGWRDKLKPDQQMWMDRLGVITGGGIAMSRAMRSTLVDASCSLIAYGGVEADQIRTALRIGNYAYHHAQFLQRPQLSEAERLTTREHECLYRAAIFGERPSAVARQLGVKVSTVRTLRQKAYGRLDADSPEQSIWRLIETGQLFRSGRRGKPRTW